MKESQDGQFCFQTSINNLSSIIEQLNKLYWRKLIKAEKQDEEKFSKLLYVAELKSKEIKIELEKSI
jgi:hypothetical protein